MKRKPVTATEAVIYLRVSTEKQARSGLGREAQEAACRARCERDRWTVLGVHVDTDTRKEDPRGRPGASAALADLETHPGAVLVVYSVSRLTSRQRALWELLDGGLPLVSATEPFETVTPAGRAMVGMLGVFAQLEVEMTSERTRAALGAAKARGVRLGRLGVGEAVSVATRARIEALRAEGRGAEAIAVALNAEGVPTVSGKGRWHPRTVRGALRGQVGQR